MFNAIRNGNTDSGTWKTLVLGNDETPASVRLPVGPVLVPLSVWKARRAELIHREYEHGWPLGIWLSDADSAAAIADDIDDFTVIGVKFDRFSDGASYATVRALRGLYGYTGELRALGDVPNDRPVYHYQAGFKTDAIRTRSPASNLAVA